MVVKLPLINTVWFTEAEIADILADIALKQLKLTKATKVRVVINPTNNTPGQPLNYCASVEVTP